MSEVGRKEREGSGKSEEERGGKRERERENRSRRVDLLPSRPPAYLPARLHLNRIADGPAHRISMQPFVTIAALFTSAPLRGNFGTVRRRVSCRR